jgi:hypothetical protein
MRSRVRFAEESLFVGFLTHVFLAWSEVHVRLIAWGLTFRCWPVLESSAIRLVQSHRNAQLYSSGKAEVLRRQKIVPRL